MRERDSQLGADSEVSALVTNCNVVSGQFGSGCVVANLVSTVPSVVPVCVCACTCVCGGVCARVCVCGCQCL